MLTTVEAEIDINGNVKLLEPLKLLKKSRAIVTLLEENNSNKSNDEKTLAFLNNPKFKNRKSYSPEEIETQIQEARNSWE